ncbi:EAL domain-containing protein [Vibrio gangliei]|uniref:EAL domain-containing protein n=1 Tax=Vibrio gangliei TaxID=2077090 RepID=UPI000D0123D6|nr:EAL domain-containing protein [Vibrio gangliei]
MPNSTISPTAFRKVIITLMAPLPFILAMSVYFSELSIKNTLQLVATTYVSRIEVLVNELRDENQQALYDAQNCKQIQHDLLFEAYLREMFLVENSKITCSSKRSVTGTHFEQYRIPSNLLQHGEFLYDLPKYHQRSLIVVDQDKNNPTRFALSIIDSAYLNIRLGVNSDDRVSDSHLFASGLYYPEINTQYPHDYNVSAQSTDMHFKVYVEPSKKLIREKRTIYLLSAIPISLIISVLFYLISFWAKGRRSLIEDLKKGLKNHQFYLVYQPLIDSKTDKIGAVEALIRWNHPNNGLIRPDIFIPLAEQHGQINAVTDFVLEQALKDWEDKVHKDMNFHLGINVPPTYLSQPNCISRFHNLAQRFKAQNIQLCIEITERQLLDEAGRRVLTDIRKLGIVVAIDDFGTGHTSLAVLQDTDFDYLKIDRCFINTIGVESVNAPILNNIIQLAHDLEVQIVAEGVETQQQADYLIKHKVEYLQGFLFYKPLSLSEAVKLVSETSPINDEILE